jgi:intraflagellar transport protein 172
VYKIGTEWGEKKSICNKFPTSTAVTCMTWPRDRPDLIYGLTEGKVQSIITNLLILYYIKITYDKFPISPK